MDIYALGVLCYECLSGHPPFYTGELIYQILQEEPEDLEDVPSHVRGAIRKALAKDPSERPASARTLIDIVKADIPVPDDGQSIVATEKAGGLPLAVAPFDAAQAKEYQEQTAQALGVSIDKAIDLGAGVRMEFVLIPAGEFDMGSPSSEQNRSGDEGPVHRVKISKPFYMGKFPVTQEQYKAIIGKNPSDFSGKNLPVESVSWADAVRFCRKLSSRENKTYRLPTEAEWEYACRAGTQARFCFGDDESSLDAYAWYADNSDYKTHPVGQKQANAFDLYDMHGNVREWCSDWYDENYYSQSPSSDPQGPDTGSSRVLRGGSWFFNPRRCRSADRDGLPPVCRSNLSGFRVVLLDFQ
jgi:formylglycine-generating enzyme required for sulfatase activity